MNRRASGATNQEGALALGRLELATFQGVAGRSSTALRLCALTVLTLLAVSCGGDDLPTESETPVATTVDLSSSALSFTSLGASEQVTATVKDQNAVLMSEATVTWTSADEAVATVSSTGLVTSVGNGSATITATSGSASESASVTVEQVAASIVLSTSAVVLAGPGDTATVTATVMDAAGSEIASPSLEWSSDDEGIATVSSSGVVTAVSSGSTTMAVEVVSGALTVTETLSITVHPILAVTTMSLPNGVEDVDYGSETMTATGGDGSYSWALVSGSLPTGLNLATNGAITGTPTTVERQNFTVEVASGDGQTAQQALSITVYATLTVTTTSLPNGVEDVDYGTATLTAAGGDGSYSWALVSGSLPTGLNLATNGEISGTPTVVETQDFTVEVASGDGQTAQQALSVGVNRNARNAPCNGTPGVLLSDTVSGVLQSGVFCLQGSVRATSLVIEAGVLVYADAGATLEIVDSLRVSGTADDPVVFTAANPEAPWGGILGDFERFTHNFLVSAAAVRMSHVVLQHATQGLSAGDLTLESVRFRKITGPALAGLGTVKNVVAHTVCSGGGSCAAVATWGQAGRLTLTVDGAVIRDSGGHGLQAVIGSSVLVSDLRIESPAGSGVVLSLPRAPFGLGEIEVLGPVSIHEQGAFLVEGWGGPVATFMAAYADSVRPGDRVKSTGGTDQPIVVPPEVSWTTQKGQYELLPSFGTLTVGAGAEFIGSGSFTSIEAVGTVEKPVRLSARFIGGLVQVRDSGALVLEHVRLQMEGGRLEALGAGDQRLSDVDIELASVTLGAPGARVERVSLDRGGLVLQGIGSAAEDVRISRSPGHGIEIAADSVVIRRCVVTASLEDGIHVTEGTGIVIESCDLEGNAGAGVANEGTGTVTARGNWWGDPAGALGPNGDGVVGMVDHSEPRSAPTGR